MTTTQCEWEQWAQEQARAWNLEGELEAGRQMLAETGKVLSAPEAIRRHCLQCKGYRIEKVRRCATHGCWLHPWRTGFADHRCGCHCAPDAEHRNDGAMPTGRYTAVLRESDMVRTRRHGRCLALAFRVTEGEHKDRIIKSKLYLEHRNLGRRNDALDDLHSICRCVGVLKPNDSSELHGIPLVLHVEQQQGRDGRRSVIEGYERLEKKASTETEKKATGE